MEQRANIKFCEVGQNVHRNISSLRVVREGLWEQSTDVPIHPPYINLWMKFRDDRESLEDDKHSGKPSTSWTIEIVEEIHDLIKQDRCLWGHRGYHWY